MPPCGAAAVAVSALSLTACGGDDERVSIVGLRCEYAEEPLAIDGDSVRFTWRYESDEPVASFRQHKVEVRIAADEASLADDETCVVTSGRVRGGQMVVADGQLKAESRYCWQVRGYNALGVERPWSRPWHGSRRRNCTARSGAQSG